MFLGVFYGHFAAWFCFSSSLSFLLPLLKQVMGLLAADVTTPSPRGSWFLLRWFYMSRTQEELNEYIGECEPPPSSDTILGAGIVCLLVGLF